MGLPPALSAFAFHQRSSACFCQARDIAGERVDFEIDLHPLDRAREIGGFPAMRDDVDAEMGGIRRVFDLVHRQRDAVDRDRAFRRDETAKLARGSNSQASGCALGPDRDDLADPVYMARDNMPAKLVADLQRGFQIDPCAFLPEPDRGARAGLGRSIDIEPALPAIPAARHDSQADAGTGDRGADIDLVRRTATGDPDARISLIADAEHMPDLANNPGEHMLYLAPLQSREDGLADRPLPDKHGARQMADRGRCLD